MEAVIAKFDSKVKPNIMDLYWYMVNVADNHVDGDPDSLANRWVMVEVSAGKRIPHIVTADNCLEERDISVLARDIAEFIKGLDPLATQRKWSQRIQDDCARFVIKASKSVVSIDAVARIAWKNENVLAFARTPWDRSALLEAPETILEKECPVFWEFLSRFESKQQAVAYCSFLGSIMVDRTNRTHRGVILYGEGRNGKSAQLRLMDSIFGNSIVYKACGSGGDFRSEGMERARIITYADSNDRNLFTDALTKSLIGGDKIEVNLKGVRQFTCRPLVKVIACTNKLPNIRDNVAEKRRWIFCSISGFDGVSNPRYQEFLNNEAKNILACCCDMYEQLRHGDDIAVDESALDEVTSTADADVDYFCEMHFEMTKDGFVRSSHIAALMAAKNSKLGKDRVVSYLKKHYGCKLVVKWVGYPENKAVKGWQGINMRTASKQLVNFQDHADLPDLT